MKTIEQLLTEHPFFKDIDQANISFIAGCGQNKIFKANEVIHHEGDQADYFYLIRKGQVHINTSVPNQENKTIQTVGEGDILGWSWLFEPYRWIFEAKASTEVHAVALDGQCLRQKCEQDTKLGYQLMKRFAQLMINRLTATRLQLLDVYGKN